MKQWLSILLCLLLATSWAQAQDEPKDVFLDISTWGKPFELPRNEYINELHVLRNGKPLLVTSDNQNLFLRSFDPITMALGPTITLSSNSEKTIENYSVVGDSLFTLIKSGSRSKGYQFEVVIYKISGSNQGEVLRKDVGLALINNDKSTQEIFFSVSDNGQYTAVCRQSKFLGHEYASLHLSITNGQTGTETHFELPTQIEGDDLELLAMGSGSNGLVYIIGLAGIKLNSPFRKKHLLYTFNPETKALHEFDFAAEDLFIQDLMLTVGKSGVKAVALHHTDPLTESASNGYAYIQFNDLGTDVVKKSINAFRADMIKAQHWNSDRLRDNEIGFLLLNTIVECDSSSVIVFEKFFKDEVCQTDPRTGIITCTDQYHFQSVSFENLDNRTHSTTIQRRQTDYDYEGYFTSHTIVEDDNRTLLFYNDHYKNIGLNPEKVMNNSGRSMMRVVSIDCEANTKTWVLSKERQSDYAFVASLSMPKFQNHLFMLSSNGRSIRLGKLDLAKLPAP
jgi:hypothetical protein